MGDEAIFAFDANGSLELGLGLVSAISAGLAAQVVIWWLLKKLSRRFSYTRFLLEATAGAARVVFPLLLLQFVWMEAANWSWSPLADQLTRILLIIAITWLTVSGIGGATAGVIAFHSVPDEDDQSARRIQTQAVVIARSLKILVIIAGLGLALMTIPGARTLGTSMLASAGLAGIVAGVAARPVLTNLIAGMQIALSQPFRLDDVLIVQGEWGRVEEITSTYVSLRIWDERRLVVPLQWFIENPFQNWTRVGSRLLGTVFWWVDYRMPLRPLREQLQTVCENAGEWDGRLNGIQVTDVSERAMQIRALVSAKDSADAWNLRCKVREALIAFMQEHYPQYLPRQRNDVMVKNTADKSMRPSGEPA